MSFTFTVPNLSQEPIAFELEPGSSTFFVGANGSGKTRLAAQAESQLGKRAHRISAHRALSLNPTVAKISEQKARAGLRFGVRFPQPPSPAVASRTYHASTFLSIGVAQSAACLPALFPAISVLHARRCSLRHSRSFRRHMRVSRPRWCRSPGAASRRGCRAISRDVEDQSV